MSSAADGLRGSAQELAAALARQRKIELTMIYDRVFSAFIGNLRVSAEAASEDGSSHDGYRPAIAVVVGGTACRPQGRFLLARSAITRAVRGLVRGAGICRGRDRRPAGLAGQRDPSARAAHRTDDAPTVAGCSDICGPRRNSPARNCSPRAKQKSSNLPACSATASAAICICPNSPCWNGTAPTPAYDAVMADTHRGDRACRAGDRHRTVLVSGQDRRSLCRAGTADGRSRVRALCRDRSAGDDHGMARAIAPRLRTRRKERIRITDDDTWSDIFSKVLVEHVEPHLGQGRLTVLFEYPVPEAALARAKPADPRVAERFEVYACGVELANGFGELTDAAEQRRRFTAGDGRKTAPLWRALSAGRGFSRRRRQHAGGQRRRARLRPAGDAGERRAEIDQVVWTPPAGEA